MEQGEEIQAAGYFTDAPTTTWLDLILGPLSDVSFLIIAVTSQRVIVFRKRGGPFLRLSPPLEHHPLDQTSWAGSSHTLWLSVPGSARTYWRSGVVPRHDVEDLLLAAEAGGARVDRHQR